MKKYISMIILLAGSINSYGADKWKLNVDYNGGDGKAHMCWITLKADYGNLKLVEVAPWSRVFDGPNRRFQLHQKNKNQMIAIGSAQEWSWPEKTDYNPDEVLVVNLNEDGSPNNYNLFSKKKNSETSCSGLADAPY